MKHPFIDYELYKNSFSTKANITHADNIKTTSRSSTILQRFVGKTFSIHNGKSFEHITITSTMVGQKLGTFVLTKKLGNSIHNSDHNRKVKEKARRKITAKKKKTRVSL